MKKFLGRGATQKLKNGVREGLALVEEIRRVSKLPHRWKVLELYFGMSEVSLQAGASQEWYALQPFELMFGDDLRLPQVQREVDKVLREEEPDLLVQAPPCGPWSALQNLAPDQAAVAQKRQEHLPLWRGVRRHWDAQHRAGRLNLTEQPQASMARQMDLMTGRPGLCTAIVDQCRDGLKDPFSHLDYRKRTALDVNDPICAEELAKDGQCCHERWQHEPIIGTTLLNSGCAAFS